jgi:ABC-type polysaccharide/polyol phosphate transport system ATPase subunit
MSTSNAISFEAVTKTFRHQRPRLLLRERLLEVARRKEGARFAALDDVSFSVAPGDSLGLIGANGAGKSTLLNLATGLAKPDSGRITVNGKVAALLELGAGFHPDLTGAENVRINAALMGLSRRETAQWFEQIVEFSGVRDFIDDPLRTYSNGMMVRLAFSVAIHTDPDILLIDEIIGMGDQTFYARCLDKVHQFQKEGKTIVLASHSLELLSMLCQRALWLDHGKRMMWGDSGDVVRAYRSGSATA